MPMDTIRLSMYNIKYYLMGKESSLIWKPAYWSARCIFLAYSRARQLFFANILKRPDYGSEIGYWESLLDGAGDSKMREYPSMIIDKAKRKAFFPARMAYFASRAGSGGAPKVLDIGSGPFSQLVHGVDAKILDVVAVDPLAKSYAELLRKKSISFPIKPLASTGEDAAKLFKPGTFHIVYMSNSLDHVTSPRAVASNSCALVKKGGFIYIESAINEGTMEGWRGLHQHNLYLRGNELWCEGNAGSKSNLFEGLPVKTVYRRIIPASKSPNGKRLFTIVFQKIR